MILLVAEAIERAVFIEGDGAEGHAHMQHVHLAGRQAGGLGGQFGQRRAAHASLAWPHAATGEALDLVDVGEAFPHGGTDIEATVAETKQAVADGADEIDVVLPYKAFMDGDTASAKALLDATRKACAGKTMKVIIESGVLAHANTIAEASRLSIACGADFIKTSTGKTPVSATLEAANVMLEVIRESGKPVGFKASGGVRSTEQAADYMTLADKIMGPKWISLMTFRFGASGLRDSLLASMGYGQAPADNKGY